MGSAEFRSARACNCIVFECIISYDLILLFRHIIESMLSIGGQPWCLVPAGRLNKLPQSVRHTGRGGARKRSSARAHCLHASTHIVHARMRGESAWRPRPCPSVLTSTRPSFGPFVGVGKRTYARQGGRRRHKRGLSG